MSEEEKKAIKWFDTERKLVEITNGDNNYFSIILNLIDKLQKENEELKEAIKEYEDMITHYNQSQKIYSKIKAKIKEYETKATSIEAINVVRYTTKEEKSKIRLYRNIVKILKELLEE